MLNCAGNSIVTTLSAKDGVIEVSENKDTEPSANCSCAYDISYEVGPLEGAGMSWSSPGKNLK